MKPLLHEIGEDALIERLLRRMPREAAPAAGPGDDCAVVDASPGSGPGAGFWQLLKTDALVEHVHFLPGEDGRRVGWKAVARVISDFAAMGGRPERFLVTLALPPAMEVGWVEALYDGMGACMERFGTVLAGGETSSVPAGSAAVISVAAVGRVKRAHVVLRSTGAPGDALLVTGALGGSIGGRHLDFVPRVEQAEWLAEHFKPTAMMDLSDGLAKDLPRLAAASGCGFRLAEEDLPVAAGCTREQALGDGEDYELLLAVAADRVAALREAWQKRFPELPLTVIGALCEGGEGGDLQGGWEHFRR